MIRGIVILFVLSGCMTSHKAVKKLNKIYNKKPVVVADFTRTKFPCITTSIDTLVDTAYDFIEVECPEQAAGKIDTLYITKNGTKEIKVLTKEKIVALPQKTVTITKYIKDGADIFIKQNEIDALKHKLDKKSTWMFYMWILIIILLLANIFQFFWNKL